MNTFIKEALLTRSGNLFIEPTGKYEGYSLFTTANGEFLRFVEEEDEANSS